MHVLQSTKTAALQKMVFRLLVLYICFGLTAADCHCQPDGSIVCIGKIGLVDAIGTYCYNQARSIIIKSNVAVTDCEQWSHISIPISLDNKLLCGCLVRAVTCTDRLTTTTNPPSQPASTSSSQPASVGRTPEHAGTVVPEYVRIKVQETELCKHQLSQLNGDLDQTKAELDASRILSRQLAEARRAELEKKADSCRLRAQQLEKQLQESDAELSIVRREKEAFESRVTELEEKADSCRSRSQQLEHQLQQIKNAEAELSIVRQEKATLESRVTELVENRYQLDNALKLKTKQLAEAMRNLSNIETLPITKTTTTAVIARPTVTSAMTTTIPSTGRPTVTSTMTTIIAATTRPTVTSGERERMMTPTTRRPIDRLNSCLTRERNTQRELHQCQTSSIEHRNNLTAEITDLRSCLLNALGCIDRLEAEVRNLTIALTVSDRAMVISGAIRVTGGMLTIFLLIYVNVVYVTLQ